MKLLSVVGARPQFIKASALLRASKNKCEHLLVHTGQHYDKEMSKIFFEELKIQKPDYTIFSMDWH